MLTKANRFGTTLRLRRSATLHSLGLSEVTEASPESYQSYTGGPEDAPKVCESFAPNIYMCSLGRSMLAGDTNQLWASRHNQAHGRLWPRV